MNRNLCLIFLVTILFCSCEKEVDFDFDLNHLTGTNWGIPQILELAPGLTQFDLSAPTIFYDDNTVAIGTSKYDIWSVRSSRTILLEQSAELWFIIELTPSELRVEKTRFPSGEFIMRCVYLPLE